MFAKLKKKIAEEAAVAPRPGGAARIPRSVSKESITSVGADSGDDFASDGSSSREDLSSQLFRRNEQIRKLEVKLSASMRKFQEQNEAHQASRAKMAEGMALALGKKDKEWMEILAQVEKEKKMLQTQLQEMREQSLNLFQKRDEIDELEGFQQQEIAKVKHMLLKKEESLSRAEQELEARAQELSQAQAELQAARSESSGLRRDLQDLQQHLLQLEARRYGAEDFPGAVDLKASLQKRFSDFSFSQMTLEFAERDKLTEELQEKVSSLEKKLERNLSGDEHVQELLKEVIKKELEEKLQIATETLKKSKEAAADQDLKIQKLVSILHVSLTSYRSLLSIPRNNHFSVWLFKCLFSCCLSPELRSNEMSSRETVSVEIAKALEETRKQREELQQQVSHLNALIKEKDQLIDEKCDLLLKQKEELNQLSQEESTRALNNEHCPSPENSVVEQNGEVAAADVIQLQKDNRELEQQIAEKNKMIKQLQQRMAELKKTLQKELKIRPDSEVPELRTNSEVPNASVTVTNNSDLNDSREINFEYLKHVVLKFMSCRESEAFHLIKAVSVLLNFSQEEENMLKETLEYKMSWFGSKPSPKGSIRPSISSPRTLWP
uniref:Golgin subfamily A member 1 n=1 Tax=Catharus ustulatus TaxID=91951 RepID=A0A8C3V7N4_CATUS